MKSIDRASINLLVKYIDSEVKNHESAAKEFNMKDPIEGEPQEYLDFEAAHADGRACGAGLVRNIIKDFLQDLDS